MSVPHSDMPGSTGSQQVPMSSSVSSNSNTPSPPRIRRRDGKKFVGCSPFEDYELTTKLGEGTFGEVHKAVHRATGAIVALKRVLMHNEKEGLPITAIREIKLLKSLNHPNIVSLSDMLVRHEASPSVQTPSVYMVFPYMEHDLTGLLENPKVHLRLEHIKLYLRQLLEGTAYLHASKVMHRDMKASNLLINNEGQLFIADFGLARSFNPDEKKDMTKCVVTRWYRPPELLLGDRRYTTAIDMWGVGCILAEMMVGKPIFQGSTDLNQIDQVMRICGSPNDSLWPGWRDLPDCRQVEDFAVHPRRVREEYSRFGEDLVDLLDQLLQLDPRRRPSAVETLKHRFFFTAPFPARPEDMPKFEHSHEFDRRKHRSHRGHPGSQNQAAPSSQQQQIPHAPPHPTQTSSQSVQLLDSHSNTRQSDSRNQGGRYVTQNSPGRRRDSNRYNHRRDDSYASRPRNSTHRDSRRNGYGADYRGSSRNGYQPYNRSGGRGGGYNNTTNNGSDAGWK
ncbi:serine/threonine protein kinase, CMGC, CDC2/CDK sub [Coemansia sp. RSA 1365]|nr:serine/threonine protein kinase, CMGC, CDC2/CDK sub [Coemansia sp. RSA 1365]